MAGVASIGILGAFAGGLVSFFSPCTLPLVPGYLSFIAGQGGGEVQSGKQPQVMLSLFFILGFSTVFVALGAGATAFGSLLQQYRYEANFVGGGLVILFGIFMTGLLKLRWLQRDFRIHTHLKGGTPITAYLLGLAFAFGWTPCIGPVLAAILTFSTVATEPSVGVIFLSIYSLGLGIPFLLAAIFMEQFKKRVKVLNRFSRNLHLAAGVIMIIMGIAMVTGQLTLFSIWMLQMFPGIANLG
jgi:cytochrome c-type biogenesis protein